ncbi:MAG: prepilin-type N-terminal cleavage/methylation domain-containing protein [Candidatus Gracilibacteria bacterium]|nr:prepilin-type N-terminal cleavage/methylation domain-containing protein [Candidatus Gracilibacteria bacterium]
MKICKKAFTLIEMILAILIFTIVIIGGFQALSAVGLGKVKLIEETNITKDAYYFSQKLFEEIKSGGTIDFEEYFNRKVIGNTTGNGHYDINSGFGNFGSGGTVGNSTYGDFFYYCRSGSGITTENMGTGGCYNNDFNNYGVSVNLKPQRYGEYAFQFIDYNSNMNGDGGYYGDENLDGNIRGDDDDENIGEGPEAFTGGTDIKEIYLISGDKKKRTIFRWNWIQDPVNPNICDGSLSNFGTGCLGTIEFLKLEGKDRGINHNSGAFSTGSYDGIIDTWIVDKNFTGGVEIIAGSDNNNYWQSLFPDSISVADFKVFIYPNFNQDYAWKKSSSNNVNPYVRIQLTLKPSWKKRSAMRGIVPEIKISTTINLTDYFSK